MSTKERILDAAESRFADHGFSATSLRDITAAAEVNLAAVNYHFGSKLELLRAVFARRFGPINRERLDALDALLAAGEPDVEEVLRAFFEPLFRRLRESGDEWGKFMQLVGRTHSDTSPDIRHCLVEQIEEVARRFSQALARALPDLSPGVLSARIHFVVGAMAHTITFCRHADVPLAEALPGSDALMAHLLDFAAAGLRAPEKSVMPFEKETG